MEIARLAELINDAASRDPDLNEIDKEVRGRIENPEDPNSQATVWALNYMFIDSRTEERRADYGPFGPIIESGGNVFPPRLADVHADTLAIWQEFSERLDVSAASARVHDLLWVRRFGESPHRHARQAIADYLAVSQIKESDGLDAMEMLDRALELARSIGDPDLTSQVVALMTDVITEEIELEDAVSSPGIYMPLLKLLADLPEDERPSELGPLLQRTHEVHEGSHPLIRESLFQLSEMLEPDPERRGQLKRQKVQMSLDWALKQDGLMKVIELSKALELANNTPEASDFREDIRRHLQEVDEASLDLKSVSSKVEIPVDEAEKLINVVVGEDDLDGGLGRFGEWGPPTGEPRQTIVAVEDRMRRFPMQFLISHVVTHSAGYPIKFLNTDEEKRLHAQVRQEVFAASMHVVFAMEALDRIRKKYNPKLDEIRALFQTDLITADQADAFARAFEHYWGGRFDEAIHVSLPRIENVLRHILATLGGVVYREPRGQQPGGVKMLGDILQGLRPFLDEGWWRFLWVVLVEPLGFNLRNEYLHGLVSSGSKHHATLVLQAAAYLRLVRVQGASPQGEPEFTRSI